jgi:hypothetical protein
VRTTTTSGSSTHKIFRLDKRNPAPPYQEMKTHTFSTLTSAALIMFSRKALSFVASPVGRRAFHSALSVAAKAGQAEVILVGCGAPNRGMGWYHGIQVCVTRGGILLGWGRVGGVRVPV